MSDDQLSDQHPEVLSPGQLEDLKQAWLKGMGLSTLPPAGNLVMRLIATVEQARRAFDLANKKWDEYQARAEKAEARVRELQAEVVKVSSLEHLAQAEREYFAKRAYEAEGKVMADGVNAGLLHQIEKTEAELARVTAEAATLREALDTYAQYHENGETALVAGYLAKRALSSTSAGAGLLKRLEASEAVIKLAPQHGYCHVESSDGYHGTSHADWCLAYQAALEAWKRARGEP